MREKIEDKANPLAMNASEHNVNTESTVEQKTWHHDHDPLIWVARKIPLAEEGKFGYVADLLTETEAKKREAEEKQREEKANAEKAAREEETRAPRRGEISEPRTPEENGMIDTLAEESGVSKEDILDEEEYDEEQEAIDAEGRQRKIVVKKKRPRKR